jgi:hypothetical protein
LSSPPPLLSSLSATTAHPLLLRLRSLLLLPPSLRPQPLPPLRLRALSPRLLPTPPPTAPLPFLLLLALVLLQSPPLAPLLSRALLLPSLPLALVSLPSSVSSPLCKRLEPEVCTPPRPNLYDSKGHRYAILSTLRLSSRLLDFTFSISSPIV